MLYGVCRMLHVYARIIENILAYKARRICNYTCTYTCIYGVSGSLMLHLLGAGAARHTIAAAAHATGAGPWWT